MVKYVCSVCGYEYEESNENRGMSCRKIGCARCGASKSEFVKKGEAAPVQEEKEVPLIEVSTEVDELSPLEPVRCFQILPEDEKQYKQEESELFKESVDIKKVAAHMKVQDLTSCLKWWRRIYQRVCRMQML